MKNDQLYINKDRLQKRLEKELPQYGMNDCGGMDRCLGSVADLEAREWFCEEAKKIGAIIAIDAVANIWVTLPGTDHMLKPIVIGSHLDTVPNGGKYDGAMGVLLGLEIMEVLKESRVQLKHPLQVVAFTGEEPNPFGISTLGSRSVTGKLDIDILSQAQHKDSHERLSDRLKLLGGNLLDLNSSQLRQGDKAAFIECHIEQGNNLDLMHYPVAIVTGITGIYRDKIIINGEANHAGTTLMECRHDALLAAAEFVLAVETTVKSIHKSHIVGTVGQMTVFPNAANIIPGKVELTLELRVSDDEIKEEILRILQCYINNISRNRGVLFSRQTILDQQAVVMSPLIVETLKNVAEKDTPKLISMAGHDAVHMTDVAPTGMLFVRSIGGRSHCASEYSLMDDIECAGNVLLRALMELDDNLN